MERVDRVFRNKFKYKLMTSSREKKGPRFFSCPICFCRVPSSRCVSLQPCGHFVCKACLIKQLHHDARCCMCREGIQKTSKRLFVDEKGMLEIRIEKLNPDMFLNFHFKFKDCNMTITRIQRGSPCHRRGLREGDMIYAINHIPLFNSKCSAQILSNSKKGSLIILTVLKKETRDEERGDSEKGFGIFSCWLFKRCITSCVKR